MTSAAEPDPGLPGPWLVRTSGLVEVRYTDAAAREGVTAQQSRILVFVCRHPSNMAGIGAEFGLGKSTMTGVIARMEALGLVERTADPVDRRNLVVRATADGRAVADRMVDAVRAEVGKLLDPLPEQDRRDLARILAGVVEAHRADAAQADASQST